MGVCSWSSRLGLIRQSIAVVFSLFILFVGWSWNPHPDWIVDACTIPIGITRQGELVAVLSARDSSRKVNSTLVVYEVSSGHELRRSPILWEPGHSVAVLAHDDEWIVLVLGSPQQALHPFAILSVRDGSVLHAPANVFIDETISVSPDGRYMGVRTEEPERFIYEVASNKLLFPGRKPVFSSDGRQWAEEDSSGENIRIKFHSMDDGRLLGSHVLPFPWQTGLRLTAWTGNRLEFSIREGASRLISPYSCTVDDYVLKDIHTDVFVPYSGDLPGTETVELGYVRGKNWAGQWMVKQTNSRAADLWNRLVPAINLPRAWYVHAGYQQTWQSMDPESGKPCSRVLNINGSNPRFSPDGQWLVTGGQTLQCWRIPPRSPWPFTLLAATAPWLWMEFQWFRRREVKLAASNAASIWHSPSSAWLSMEAPFAARAVSADSRG